jgi:hypothetical protein
MTTCMMDQMTFVSTKPPCSMNSSRRVSGEGSGAGGKAASGAASATAGASLIAAASSPPP